jgi:hypothetical protein
MAAVTVALALAAQSFATIALDPITTIFGVASLVGLVLLLLLKEIVRVNPGHRGYPRLGTFDLVIIPLFLLFGLVVVARLVGLLQA